MELSPQSVRSTVFKTVKKGYDPDEVDTFQSRVAGAIETAQNQATAMEARARAAVAKLQEVSQQSAATKDSATPAQGAAAAVSSDDAATISRTLVLAQRTADATVAEAQAEAESVTSKARNEATTILDGAHETAAKLISDAKTEGRRANEEERMRAANEVQSLIARRDFLVADVEQLEQHLVVQRERLRDAAVSIHELIERVPGGLGEVRRPLLSSSDEVRSAESTNGEGERVAPDANQQGFAFDESRRGDEEN